MINMKRTDISDSCIFEHPYIVVVGTEQRARYEPMDNIQNRADLCSLFQRSYPCALRKIHLIGLYPYITADLDDLLLKGTLLCLDEKLGSLIWSADVCTSSWSEILRKTWLQVAENQKN